MIVPDSLHKKNIMQLKSTDEVSFPSIKSEEKFHKKTLSFLIELRKVLKLSYGPMGSNTLIDKNREPVITKDGYTILNSLNCYEAQESLIHSLIKRVSHNLVKTVGDGSTSAIIAASHIYENLLPLRNMFVNKKDLTTFLEIYTEEMINKIQESYTFKINNENRKDILKTISNLSNNNDKTIGDSIASIFSKASNIDYISDIRIEINPHDTSNVIDYRFRNGFKYNCSFSNNSFFKNALTNISVENPLIFASYEMFADHFKIVKGLYSKLKRPIIVLSEVITQDVVTQAVTEYLRENQEIYLVRVPDNSSERNHDNFIDLLVYLDADAFSENFNENSLGTCSKVEFYGNHAVFLGGGGYANSTDFYSKRIEDLRNLYHNCPVNLPAERGIYKQRLANLQSISIQILVGGITEEEKNSRRFLVEDSIQACKSAIKDGYSFGSNATLFMSSASRTLIDNILKRTNLPEDITSDLIDRLHDAFSSLYYAVSSSKYEYHDWRKLVDIPYPGVLNAISGKYETIEQTKVISPVETDIQILKASFSIVGMLLSINQFIS